MSQGSSDGSAMVPQSAEGAADSGSRIAGFYKLPTDEKIRQIAERCGLDADDVRALHAHGALPKDIAERMIENAIGTLEVPLGEAPCRGCGFLLAAVGGIPTGQAPSGNE